MEDANTKKVEMSGVCSPRHGFILSGFETPRPRESPGVVWVWWGWSVLRKLVYVGREGLVRMDYTSHGLEAEGGSSRYSDRMFCMKQLPF